MWIWRRSEGVAAGLMWKYWGGIVVGPPDVKIWSNRGFWESTRLQFRPEGRSSDLERMHHVFLSCEKS